MVDLLGRVGRLQAIQLGLPAASGATLGLVALCGVGGIVQLVWDQHEARRTTDPFSALPRLLLAGLLGGVEAKKRTHCLPIESIGPAILLTRSKAATATIAC